MEQDTSPRILHLPREIRDEIYFYLLDEYVDPPRYPMLAGNRTFNNEGQHRDGGARLNSIRYPGDAPPINYPNLLKTNRQIRSEVLDLINQRLGSESLTAELDIMFKGYQSWPTWSRFPMFVRPSALAHSSDERQPSLNVTVSMRIFSTEGFKSNDGWPRQPGTNFRDLLMLLRQFLQYGPSFGQVVENENGVAGRNSRVRREDEGQGGGVGQVYKINILTVNVSFEDIYTPATHPETVHQIFKALKEVAESGVFVRSIKTVRARAKFLKDGELVEWENQWPMNESQVFEIVYRWHGIGLMVTETVGDRQYLAII